MWISQFTPPALTAGFRPIITGLFAMSLAGATVPALASSEASPRASSILSADGVAKPTLALNLASPSHWGMNMPFLDLMKMAGTFRTDSWGRLKDADLDENGWPTKMPEGTSKLISIFKFARPGIGGPSFKPGRYVLSFEGEGILRIRGGAVVSQTETEMVFDYDGTRTMHLEILSTDPENTGDYLRNIRMVHEDYIALHEAGGLFNPDWIRIVADTSQVRFMDWMETNNSKVSDWEDLVSSSYASWARKGVPVEVMVALANQIGADPWFTIPHLATDAFIREFATYVRDHLDPALVATVEYSNEAWNSAFKHTQWMHDEAKKVFQDEDTWSFDYYAKRATEAALIWKEVFGAEAETRLVAALGSQTVNTHATERILAAQAWKRTDPTGFVDPASVFDAVAVTTYFGGKLIKDDARRAELLRAIEDPDTDANRYAYDMFAGTPRLSPDGQLRDFWAEQKRLAEAAGLDLIAYEGGQHIQHSFAAKIPEADLDVLTGFFTEFMRSEYIATLYAANWDAWKEVSDGPYMQYVDVSAPSKWGSWGLLASLSDTTPRATYSFERSATEEPWWDDPRSGDQALQGRTLFAQDSGETLLGTVQEDFLIGSDAADILVGGPGDDGLHGGAGSDTVVLSGGPADYTITAEGDGWRLEGPDGSDFLIAVETLSFDDGPVLEIAAFAAGQ